MKLGGDLVEEGSVSVGVKGIREGEDEMQTECITHMQNIVKE